MKKLRIQDLTPVIAVVTACAAVAVIRGADTDVSALEQRVDRLEALTQRVEALSAVKRLQYAYGHYSELGLWHDFADLFADTGIGYYTQGALDREGIRALFLKEVGGGRLGLADGRIYPHISMQPVITVAADGQSAKARWHIMAMLGGYGTSASWSGGVYENQYVRENGTWKFKEVRYFPQYSGRYDDAGWTATKQAAPFHYDAARVGKPVLDIPTTPKPEAPSPTLGSVGRRLADVAARAQHLADEIEVTNLQHSYGYYLDRKMWDDVADLFTSDGTMELGLQGVYVGPKSIRRGLNAFGPAKLAEGEINDHIYLQTIVSVSPDGRTARARGTDLGMIGRTSGSSGPGVSEPGRALWTQAIYENEFVKQNGVWKFKALHSYPRFIVDAEKGWARDAQAAPGPSREFPPDKPSTESYGVYPRFHIASLHFDHPVTARPPQYPEGTTAMARPRAVTQSASPAPTTAPAIESLLASTERSVERSRAYHAAENLATAYGFYVDESASDETADIFSRQGSREMPYVGTYVGRERIRQSLKIRYPGGKPADILTLNQIVQPVIHVSADARSAKIRMRAWQMGSQGGQGSWLSGIYENTAVDEDGTWKLASVDLEEVWTSPSRGGWVHVTAPATAPQLTVANESLAKEFPPDRPLRGSIAASFPRVQPVPFHYRNPVSGRVPPVLLP